MGTQLPQRGWTYIKKVEKSPWTLTTEPAQQNLMNLKAVMGLKVCTMHFSHGLKWWASFGHVPTQLSPKLCYKTMYKVKTKSLTAVLVLSQSFSLIIHYVTSYQLSPARSMDHGSYYRRRHTQLYLRFSHWHTTLWKFYHFTAFATCIRLQCTDYEWLTFRTVIVMTMFWRFDALLLWNCQASYRQRKLILTIKSKLFHSSQQYLWLASTRDTYSIIRFTLYSQSTTW